MKISDLVTTFRIKRYNTSVFCAEMTNLITTQKIKDENFCFAHLRWCHNGWVSNILSGGCQRSIIP